MLRIHTCVYIHVYQLAWVPTGDMREREDEAGRGVGIVTDVTFQQLQS